MRIVSLHELINMPTGTIYSYYTPAICEGLYRKVEYVSEADFFESCVIAQCINGEHPTVDSTPYRWGLFDDNAQFAVYEPADIALMKEMLGP